MTTSSSTAPGSSDGAQSSDSNGPLSLDALFSAELSGGEKQRVAVARALINRPSVVLADEPSGSLDSHSKDELHRLFFDLRRDLGQTFVIVTHDEALASQADRTIRMRDGVIID